MVETGSSAFQRKLAERRAKEAVAAAAAAPTPPAEDDYSDLFPSLDELYTRSQADRDLDAAVDKIDIIRAYARWCAKMTPKIAKGQKESIMISCPKPDHRDSNPSAWLNIDKQTWFCGTCQEGGDAHDIAAYHHGYPVPGYKTDGTFHKLRVQMAKDFGYRFESAPGGDTYIVAPEPADDEPAEDPEPVAAAAPSDAPVAGPEPSEEPSEDDDGDAIVLEMYDDGDIPQYDYPTLDWRSIVPKDSFLDIYMQQTIIDDVPEEYHFWNALVTIGFACGRRARLFDLQPVYGNLFICMLGASGSGKSKSLGHAKRLHKEGLPHDWSDPESRGVRLIASPGSAEVLIQSFQKPFLDPTDPKKIMFYVPVTGLVDFNEFSQLMSRAGRMGNALKPTLMQFYDMEDTISTSSLTTGTKEASDAFASIVTTTQPAAFRTLVSRTDDDSGFLNRWVFVAGPEKKKISIGGARVDITPAVAPLQRILAWSGTLGDDEFCEWSPEAFTEFDRFFHNTLQPKKTSGGSALLSRIDLLMKKLVLLLTANKREKFVSGKTVREAISIYPYLLACYGMPEAELGKTLASEIADAVEYQVRKQYEKDGKGVTISQINRNLARRNYPKDMLIKAIEQLVKLEQIEIVTTEPGSRGRPTTRYRYVG